MTARVGALARTPAPPGSLSPRANLLRFGLVRRMLSHRAFQFALILPNLAFFTLAILAGFFGTPVGNANFAIVSVWIVWWALLIVLLVPLGGRAWCAMCPIPAAGEWTQRGAVLARGTGRTRSLGLDWPRGLRNIWPQNVAFLGLALFSMVILTRPAATAWLLLGLVVVAFALHLLFRRRVFCRYVCPVGGFIGVYSMVAPLELRVADPDVCLTHCGPGAKECVRGSAAGYGCPWLEYPGSLERNSYCGLCMECIRTCPLDNIAVSVRPFGADLRVPQRHMDEAFKSLIMLGAAIVYTAVMLGPWGGLKDAANLGGGSPTRFAVYAAAFLAVTLVVIPAIFFAAAALARRMSGASEVSARRAFVSFAYTAVPLGLAAWIAFSLSLLLANGSYAAVVISDPLGWGWDLFGTADVHWTPVATQFLPYMQAATLMLGLAASIVLGGRIGSEVFGTRDAAARSSLPMTGTLTAITLALLWLYLG